MKPILHLNNLGKTLIWRKVGTTEPNEPLSVCLSVYTSVAWRAVHGQQSSVNRDFSSPSPSDYSAPPYILARADGSSPFQRLYFRRSSQIRLSASSEGFPVREKVLDVEIKALTGITPSVHQRASDECPGDALPTSQGRGCPPTTSHGRRGHWKGGPFLHWSLCFCKTPFPIHASSLILHPLLWFWLWATYWKIAGGADCKHLKTATSNRKHSVLGSRTFQTLFLLLLKQLPSEILPWLRLPGWKHESKRNLKASGRWSRNISNPHNCGPSQRRVENSSFSES